MNFNDDTLFNVYLDENNEDIKLGTATFKISAIPTPEQFFLPDGSLKTLDVRFNWRRVTPKFTKLLTPGEHKIYFDKYYDNPEEDFYMTMGVTLKSCSITDDLINGKDVSAVTNFKLYEWIVDSWPINIKFDSILAICKFNDIDYLALAR